MLDAIAGIDIALWDLKGQHLNAPVWRLLGGQFRSQLPSYVSGLRMPTREQRCQEAKRAAARNFAGIKLNLGEDPEDDVEEVKAISTAAPGLRIFADMIGKYNAFDAIRVGRALEALRVEWMESATHPQDVNAHRSLAAQLDMPLAVGEPLRSEREFLPWFQAGAIDIAQPDIARTGITGGANIAKLAHAYHLPVALHVGVSTAIGVAATWHVASALPNFYIQEHQENIFEVANRLLRTPLIEDKGLLVVPHGPGLGIHVDGDYVQAHSVEHYTADESGPRKNAVAGNTQPLALVGPSAAQAS
jgi:L-alanine-DL-glutamate epimerase-like enolase superfamily enzyme